MNVPCRACGQLSLRQILSLGCTPLANALLSAEQVREPEAAYPLDLAFCQNCSLVQICETVPPDKLFRDYVYFSSFSETALANAKAIADRLIVSRKLGPNSLAAEVASNDGYLLRNYRFHDIPVLGIEPAGNIAKVAREKGIRTICEFFSKNLGQQLREVGDRADVVHANNVLAHVADLNGFVEGLAFFLKDTGVAVIEFPYIKDFIDHVEFDTIYHEHLCYFSLTALSRLFPKHGLQIVDAERIPIHGGSLRIFVEHVGHTDPSNNVKQMLSDEIAWGVDRFEFYQDFGVRVERLKENLIALLKTFKTQGKRIAAYGASAKGSTLLNYFGIGLDVLEFVADRSTIKQGLFTPGTHLPIVAPEKLVETRPDYVLLLTWNFAEEILRQQDAYRAQGGKFIIPIPDLKVV